MKGDTPLPIMYQIPYVNDIGTSSYTPGTGLQMPGTNGDGQIPGAIPVNYRTTVYENLPPSNKLQKSSPFHSHELKPPKIPNLDQASNPETQHTPSQLKGAILIVVSSALFSFCLIFWIFYSSRTEPSNDLAMGILSPA